MPRTYILLLHDTVRAYLLSLGSRAKQRLGEKLEFLQHGLWDTGVRVKRLKGAARAVFEARLSRGDRILFTLGRRMHGAIPIYVWGVVQHDDVTAAERRIVPANAPFLDFQPLAVEERPELDADELDDEYFSLVQSQPGGGLAADTRRDAAALAGDDLAAVSGDTGPQRWLVVDGEEWRRLQQAHRGDHVELFLYLTREQARLLDSEPPLLLSGTAGSGKTTIAVYFLLRHRVRQLNAAASDEAPSDTAPEPPTERERALFLTYSAHLKRFSEAMYRGLVAATDLERAPQTVRFATYGELLEEILSRAGRRVQREPPVGLVEFRAIFQNHPASARYDAELVWEEIRAIIKGAKPQISARRFAELAARADAAAATGRERAELAEYVVRLANLEAGARLDAVRARKTSFATLREFAASLRGGDTARRQEQQFLLGTALRLLEKQSARLDQPLLTLREYEGTGGQARPQLSVRAARNPCPGRILPGAVASGPGARRRNRSDAGRPAATWISMTTSSVSTWWCATRCRISPICSWRCCSAWPTIPCTPCSPATPNRSSIRAGSAGRRCARATTSAAVPVPEVINLSINFRSVGNIVALANELLLLKRSLIGAACRRDYRALDVSGSSAAAGRGARRARGAGRRAPGRRGPGSAGAHAEGARPAARGVAVGTGVHHSRRQGPGIRRGPCCGGSPAPREHRPCGGASPPSRCAAPPTPRTFATS